MTLLVGSIFHMTRKIVSEMTYNVSMGTLNPTIPYHTMRRRKSPHCWVPVRPTFRHSHFFVWYDRFPKRLTACCKCLVSSCLSVSARMSMSVAVSVLSTVVGCVAVRAQFSNNQLQIYAAFVNMFRRYLLSCMWLCSVSLTAVFIAWNFCGVIVVVVLGTVVPGNPSYVINSNVWEELWGGGNFAYRYSESKTVNVLVYLYVGTKLTDL